MVSKLPDNKSPIIIPAFVWRSKKKHEKVSRISGITPVNRK